MENSIFSRAHLLFELGKFEEACELLFSKNPSILCECDRPMRYEESVRYWEEQGCRIMLLQDFYTKLGLEVAAISSMSRRMRNDSFGASLLIFNKGLVSVDSRAPIPCPEYDGVPISDVDEALLQYLFATEDSKATIATKLSRFSGFSVDHIRFWTPSLECRLMHPRRVVNFSTSFGQFHIGCVGFPHYYRYSLGVRTVR